MLLPRTPKIFLQRCKKSSADRGTAVVPLTSPVQPSLNRSRHGDHSSPSPRSTPSEVRLLGARYVGLIVGIVLMAVFGTDSFYLPRCALKTSPRNSQFSFLFLSIASFTSS